DISDQDKQAILNSDSFSNFIDKSSKMVERVLNEPFDYLKDYTMDETVNENIDEYLSVKNKFCNEKVQGRSINDLDWHPKHHELCLSSYGKKNGFTNNEYGSNGLVCVWNMLSSSTTPEFEFSCQSQVLSAKFAANNNHLIIGGTYSGQIMVWDLRSKARPVLKTPISTGHAHPIYSIKCVGTQQVVSASSDGTVCVWQMDMLGKPQETLELNSPDPLNNKDISISCMDFPGDDQNTFVVGTEEGSIYRGSLMGRAGNKFGINNEFPLAHSAPVTGIKFHPNKEAQFDTSNVFITSSFDWTVKLWNCNNNGINCVRTFGNGFNPIMDVEWHPNKPCVFASVSGNGNLDLWDIQNESQNLVSTLSVNGNPLNKLSWHKNNFIAVGSVDGSTNIVKCSLQVIFCKFRNRMRIKRNGILCKK
ncbi:WD40 repeat-like protein, partial [Rozella allomycis CSF55]